MIGYSDADWGGDINDRKSTAGYIFKLNCGAVSWRNKKQTCVALSTAEAEYVALSAAAQEALWLKQLTSELTTLNDPITIFEDNQSTMTHNPQFHERFKHIGIKYHFLREHVQARHIKLVYCPTGKMTADNYTNKGSKSSKLRNEPGIANSNEH